jgi:TRAP-type C4-dicarboxylate transport system substrate-binding protein
MQTRPTIGSWLFIPGQLALLIAIGSAAFAPSSASAQTVLKLATTLPPSNSVSQFLESWAKRVNAAAGSEFQIQVVHGPTIANARNVWDRVVNGVVDIGFGIQGAVSLPFPKSTVVSLPLIVRDGKLADAAASLWGLYENGLIADEYKDVKPIALFGTPVQGLSARIPIAKLEDMRGLKVRAADKTVGDIVTALGASPISVPATEVYQALSQGVVSGSVAGWVLIGSFRLDEVVKEHVVGIPLGAPAGFVVMNTKSYAALSAKGKQILDQFTGVTLSREIGEFFDNSAQSVRNKASSDPSHRFKTLDAAESKRWEAALQGVIDQWESTTPDGSKILAAFRAKLDKRGK